MQNGHTKIFQKAVDIRATEVEQNLTKTFEKKFNQMREENKCHFDQVNYFLGKINLIPILDFVTKFRLKIVEELIKENKVPKTTNLEFFGQ